MNTYHFHCAPLKAGGTPHWRRCGKVWGRQQLWQQPERRTWPNHYQPRMGNHVKQIRLASGGNAFFKKYGSVKVAWNSVKYAWTTVFKREQQFLSVNHGYPKKRCFRLISPPNGFDSYQSNMSTKFHIYFVYLILKVNIGSFGVFSYHVDQKKYISFEPQPHHDVSSTTSIAEGSKTISPICWSQCPGGRCEWRPFPAQARLHNMQSHEQTRILLILQI